MSNSDRALKAVYVCLPFLIAYLITYFFLMGLKVYSAETSFGLFLNFPLLLMGLPWSFGAIYVSESFRSIFSEKTLNLIGVTLTFISFWFNSYLLLGKYSVGSLISISTFITILLLCAFVFS
jgi:hypothetical protein